MYDIPGNEKIAAFGDQRQIACINQEIDRMGGDRKTVLIDRLEVCTTENGIDHVFFVAAIIEDF